MIFHFGRRSLRAHELAKHVRLKEVSASAVIHLLGRRRENQTGVGITKRGQARFKGGHSAAFQALDEDQHSVSNWTESAMITSLKADFNKQDRDWWPRKTSHWKAVEFEWKVESPPHCLKRINNY